MPSRWSEHEGKSVRPFVGKTESYIALVRCARLGGSSRKSCYDGEPVARFGDKFFFGA